MSDNNITIFHKLESFSEINKQFRVLFERTESVKSLNRKEKNERMLQYIGQELFILPQYFDEVYNHFSTEAPKLLCTCIFPSDKREYTFARHLQVTVLLGKIVRYKKELSSYAQKYFEVSPSPFCDTLEDPNTIKKGGMSQCRSSADLEIAEACYFLLKSNTEFYRKTWKWTSFIKKYLNHSDPEVIWITCHCLAILFGMTEAHLEKIILSKIDMEEHVKFSVKFDLNGTLTEKSNLELPVNKQPVLPAVPPFEQVISICGIFLPIESQPLNTDVIVEVPSTYNSLQKVVLGVSENRAVCLQGPVGSGKTGLVEYLVAKTGRVLGKNFFKIQLGDQSDSNMLLGTYSCTDVAGEFVWKAGVLTQAVVEGNWLLLEDIDSASMDIVSLLTSLLENRVLTVPGYRESIPVSSSFQLFVTLRFLSTSSGHHKIHSSALNLLEKYLLRINIDPLSTKELATIVDKRFENLRTISDKLISIFQLFSDVTSVPGRVSVYKSGRVISTRDLFKWCLRVSVGFNVKSQESALRALQNAIDIFCCSNPNLDEALCLAMEISSRLGIVNQKPEYFFKQYKPNIQLTSENLVAGRVCLKRESEQFSKKAMFSFTRQSAVLLERIMCCVQFKEPVLLVGETGTGKTSSVQYLAHTVGQNLIVINMNQQSDSADLFGGFKPVDLKHVISPIKQEFEILFCDYFKIEPNRKYLSNIVYCFNNQHWTKLLLLMRRSIEAAQNRLKTEITQFRNSVEKNEKAEYHLKLWNLLADKLFKVEAYVQQKCAFAFSFIEGSLVKAVQNGYWVLLDEINLASAETLEGLSGLLEDSASSLYLLERGDKEPVHRHPNFALFACMNPSTDVGKKDLATGIRNRFTEFFVHELSEKSDLLLLVNNYLEATSLRQKDISRIVDFYLKVCKDAQLTLCDGLGHRPHFSLRSLCRALSITARNPCGTFKRSLFEAFCVSFLTQLDGRSYKHVKELITKYLIGDEQSKAIMEQPIPAPEQEKYIQIEGYWLKKGDVEQVMPPEYILTESVRRNLKDLVRVVAVGKLPVLLQGDTSVGKTSLITYLAKSTGNKCFRINNHEHTDLQEYIGSYVADTSGKLTFREGLLAQAMRKGYWIILDELNLAPTEVLEALNRVLDDNRELFIPETQKVIKADPNFILFATQNPPGAYGGRRMLSRAFRNRFVELHFTEIPHTELEVILHKRCELALSHAKKMVNVMLDLQMRRRSSAAFAGKQGFITLRDLFRWGERYRLAPKSVELYDWDQHLADEGYLILAGRVRKPEEKKEIIDVLQKHLKRDVVPYNLFTLSENTSLATRHILTNIYESSDQFSHIVWTYNLRQLAVLVGKALALKEPVLLVGETGGGKTTICQILAEVYSRKLVSVNCHMHTESSDFIGGLRPIRDHSIENPETSNNLFEWVDGPLLQAVINGYFFLADEISLADDSVLERLNSLLEPERFLLLVEKGVNSTNPNHSEVLVAHPDFIFTATMNPGGDYGKKELSPALRNRFTEIWCEPNTERNDLIAIIERNIKSGISVGNQQDGSSGIGSNIMEFIDWFKDTDIGRRYTISIRNILTWVNFINVASKDIHISEAYIHGACLTFIDSLGTGFTSTTSSKVLEAFRTQCESFIVDQMKRATGVLVNPRTSNLNVYAVNKTFGIGPFCIEMGTDASEKSQFSFNAPTTVSNTLRLLRGMQLNKAILLEGSPGVGKTSLVIELAKVTKHKIFRVNLSDQTDISDLFGSDLPVEGGSGGEFAWRDGTFLQALKEGKWILLDELNLASQSVLEGLNACLDHRGEIFVPELGKTFYVKEGTRFFACQNPLKQGGSRRGLPQSFLNRLIQVFINSLTSDDLLFILRNQFQQLPLKVLQQMVKFNTEVVKNLHLHTFGQKGAPWEFNLRDLIRWCEATIFHFESNKNAEKRYSPERTVQLIYSDRMRTETDKIKVFDIFESIFGCEVMGNEPKLYINKENVFFGDVFLKRNREEINVNVLQQGDNYLVLRKQMATLRSLAYCVNLNWMGILVGGSASGKSSVVKTLSNLAGKCLRILAVTSSMDTIDILGGFEQTDYTRHLDEVSMKTERYLFEVLVQLLFQAKNDDVLALLANWESYLALSKNKTQSLEQKSKLCLQKCKKLSDMLEQVCGFVNDDKQQDLYKMKEKTNLVYSKVQHEGSLNTGGKFEWVDSLLVKCLEEGSWLLIDNVNLCSAAVLDRLNGLLERNGVLSIPEKGIDHNGQMLEVKPHKHFRIFLSMDPGNGEISRAMRNRGVEIFLIDDNASNVSNEFDIKSLINLKGLADPRHIAALFTIHQFISSIILGDKPNLGELLQCSYLISQQIRHGIDVSKAFCSSVIEVYYQSRLPVEFDRIDALEYIQEEIKNVLSKCVTSETNNIDLYNENVSLQTHKLESCSQLEKIKHQSAVLRNYISKEPQNRPLISQILITVYTMTSAEDFPFRNVFLELGPANEAWGKLIKIFKGTVSSMVHINCTLPLNLYWNTDLPYNFNDDMMAHRVTIALQIALSYYEERLSFEKVKMVYAEKKEIMLLDYIYQRKDIQIQDHFNNVVINKYLELIAEYDVNLSQLTDKMQNISKDDVVQILYFISWRFIFHRCTQKNIKFVTPNEISVHYRWFYKYAVRKVLEITNVSSSSRLDGIVNEINTFVEEQFSSIHKMGQNYCKLEPRRPPFINEHQFEVVGTFNEIIEAYDMMTPRISRINILSILKTNENLRKALIVTKSVLDYEFTDATEHITLLKSLNQNITRKGAVSKYEIEITPFLDAFVRMMLMASFTSLETDYFRDLDVDNNVFLPTELCGLILRYRQCRDIRLRDELFKYFYLYLICSAAVKPNQYISDNEDMLNLSSFNPILTNFLSNLLLSENEITLTSLGNFKEIQQQHCRLNLAIWENFSQLSLEKYDFLYNETRIIFNSCRFIFEHFAKSLNVKGITGDTPLQELIVKCINVVKYMKDSSNSNTKICHLVKLLQHCSFNLNELSLCTNANKKLLIISDFHMELSYFRAIFNAELSPIDPLVKKGLKRSYCQEAIQFFTNFKDGLELQNKLFSNKDETNFAYYNSARNIIQELEEKKKQLEKYVAFRPSDVPYHSVSQAVEHAFSTILSSEQIYKMISVLDDCILNIIEGKPIDIGYFLSTLSQHETTVISYENLLRDWKIYTLSYPDIIEPLLSNISEFLYGFKMKISLLKKLIGEYENLKFGVDLNKMLANLVIIPSLNKEQDSYETLIANCTSKKLHTYIESVLGEAKSDEELRLLKCAIQESFNHCIFDAETTNVLRKELFEQFDELVGIFVKSWNSQEQREILENEPQSLYKIRTKCDDKSENELNDEEFKQLFPTHHTIDFMDLEKGVNLPNENDNTCDENTFSGQISVEDLKNVIRMHATILINYTKTQWLSPPKSSTNEFDLVRPFIEKHKLFKKLINKSAYYLDYTMDNKLLGSFSVLLYIGGKCGNITDISEFELPTKPQVNKFRDFYKDANESEVKSCYVVLEELLLKVDRLLEEWPDQPTLKTVKTIIERIYGFSITSPLARFLAGLELLLSKCNEWEQVAHSGVSLSDFSGPLIQQIITWRKIELSTWKDLLNITFEKLQEPLTKLWIYMYNIMGQFIVEKRFTAQELLETLQSFITTSNLAEFQSRMELLYAFHCHAVYFQHTPEARIFISILWNLYSYFLQFLPIVTQKIKDLRAPIEKKLKDYVKIVRWKDISYWSVRNTVEKSHRTLHKYIREYREVLLQPVLTYLVNIPSSDTSQNVDISDRPKRQNPKYTLDPDSYISKSSLVKKPQPDVISSEMLNKVDSYFLKSRKLCKKTISAANYSYLIESIDRFVTEIIATSSHLQNVKVDSTFSKEKQKSQAKSILQQKQRALSDLFKELSKIGLSFRTGIVELNSRNTVDNFVLSPLDFSSSISHLPYDETDKKILTIWDSCEAYYNKSLIKMDVLESALKSPAKDLGIANIERCKGFAAHLLAFIRRQKEEIIITSRVQYHLRYYLHHITETCTRTSFLPSSVVNNTTNLLKNIIVVMKQYKLVLNSCSENRETFQPGEIPLLPGINNALWFKNSDQFAGAVNQINIIVSLTTKLSALLRKYVINIPCIESELIIPSYVSIPNINELDDELTNLYKRLEDLMSIFGKCSLSDSLYWLMEEIVKIKRQFHDLNFTDSKSTENFKSILEDCTKKILLIFQNIYKKYNVDVDNKRKSEEEREIEYSLYDEHLKTHLIQNLFSDIETLQMKNVLNAVTNVASILLTTSPLRLKECLVLTTQCLPLFEQITEMYQYFVTQQVSCYRISCKLSSVLLSIFIDLVSKGFCTPSEFADDMFNDGVSKPSDGLGLGEGEGERDVSDKIESEDQLEDAEPSGKQKEDEDPDCRDEENGIEMSEDFESKLQDKSDDAENEDEPDKSDSEEQMGQTSKEADQLDQELWGSDKDEEESDNEETEEKGNGRNQEGPDQLDAKENFPTNKKEEEKEPGLPKEQGAKDKEINEMEDSEYNDQQIDPFHGNQLELPEPEPMDLPDDLQLDEGEKPDNEEQEENKFDIDNMKEQNVPDVNEDETDTNRDILSENEEDKNPSTDDEASEKENEHDIEKSEVSENGGKCEEGQEDDNLTNEEERNNIEQNLLTDTSGLDVSTTQEAMEIDHSQSDDKAQPNKAENQKSTATADELCQEDNPDADGVGQSQIEEKCGHTAQTNVSENMPSLEKHIEQTKQQKPGNLDSKRTLGDANEPVRKKMKTIDFNETSKSAQEVEHHISEMYQHIKEAENVTTQVLDAATKQQAEQQKEIVQKESENVEDADNSVDAIQQNEEEDIEITNAEQQTYEKMDHATDVLKSKKQHLEGEAMEEMKDINIDGEIVETLTVPRGGESFYKTQYDNLQEPAFVRLSTDKINSLRSEVEKKLSFWNEAPTTIDARDQWQKICSITSSLAQELSEQLRLVLEPTKASRLKGDYRTGRRINMRKIIPYIASQFRKDKIWLRRTKPSKREYKIVLAIDDSSSMADNHTKELAFESVALISKALALLESGELSVLSFGESIEILHKLTDSFTDKSGATLLQKFHFDQQRTCVAKLLDFATEMFNQSQSHSNILNAKLLVIVSDGRGVFSEGETCVRESVRRATLSNVFVIFVILDNPENKNSILDIRMPVFQEGKLLGIHSYMDVFPFPFYIILKDVNSLPNVLSDALRQWFEIVSNLDKQ